MMPITTVKSAGCTDAGRLRPNNEDFYLVNDISKLYIVADGMGGHQAGEVASRLAAESVRDYFDKSEKNISEAVTPDFDSSLSPNANQLLAAIRFSHRSVIDLSRTHAAYWKMGTTIAAVLLTDTTVVAANAGDSPIYMVHNDRIELISVIHNVAAEMAAAGYPEEAIGGRYRNMLTKAIGIDDAVDPHVRETPFVDGDIIVMATDGLSNDVSPEEIRRIARENSPETACRRLVNLANDRGGEDNITVIVIAIGTMENRGAKRSWTLGRKFAKARPDITE